MRAFWCRFLGSPKMPFLPVSRGCGSPAPAGRNAGGTSSGRCILSSVDRAWLSAPAGRGLVLHADDLCRRARSFCSGLGSRPRPVGAPVFTTAGSRVVPRGFARVLHRARRARCVDLCCGGGPAVRPSVVFAPAPGGRGCRRAMMWGAYAADLRGVICTASVARGASECRIGAASGPPYRLVVEVGVPPAARGREPRTLWNSRQEVDYGSEEKGAHGRTRAPGAVDEVP